MRLRDGAGSSWTFVVSHPKNNYVVRSRQRGKRVYLLTVRVIIKSFHICFKKNKILVAVVLVSGLIRSGLVITCLQVYTSNSVGLVTASLSETKKKEKGNDDNDEIFLDGNVARRTSFIHLYSFFGFFIP